MACSYSTNESYIVSQKYSIPRKKKLHLSALKLRLYMSMCMKKKLGKTVINPYNTTTALSNTVYQKHQMEVS